MLMVESKVVQAIQPSLMQKTSTGSIQTLSREPRDPLQGLRSGTWFWNGQLVPYLYLCITVPAVLLLCFLVPPMQSMDESRHFVRACQIAQGRWLAEVDAATGRGGGLLPEAVADFVRHW